LEGGKREAAVKERVSRLVDVIPPASALRETRKVLREKRIRVKYDPLLNPIQLS